MNFSLVICLLCVAVHLGLVAGDEAALRVVGGEDGVVGEFPWMVWLGTDDNLVCHGTLIREDMVLTTRTCVSAVKKLGTYYAFLGFGNINRVVRDDNPTQRIRVASKIKVQRFYVLRLASDANIAKNDVKNVNVIRLPTLKEEIDIMGEQDSQCVLTGWGKKAKADGTGLLMASRIQKLDIKFVEKSKCKRVNKYRGKVELCFKVAEDEGPCDLDDGAPITCVFNGERVLMAVNTGKRAKNGNSKDRNVRCRGGLVAPNSVYSFSKGIQKRLDDVTGKASVKKYPSDCAEARSQGRCLGEGPCKLSIKRPYGYKVITALCDQVTDGGDWTVIQKRYDGSVDFYKKFKEYEEGFGSVAGEYWLGLKWIQEMTNDGDDYDMRIDLLNVDNQTAYQVFSQFKLLGKGRRYELYFSTSSGTAGDNGGLIVDVGNAFSTFDNDQDTDSSINLAELFTTGWWLPSQSGSFVNLNGYYGEPGKINLPIPPAGMTHLPWNSLEMLQGTSMMIRKAAEIK